jgi:hypothetical protein
MGWMKFLTLWKDAVAGSESVMTLTLCERCIVLHHVPFFDVILALAF